METSHDDGLYLPAFKIYDRYGFPRRTLNALAVDSREYVPGKIRRKVIALPGADKFMKIFCVSDIMDLG